MVIAHEKKGKRQSVPAVREFQRKCTLHSQMTVLAMIMADLLRAVGELAQLAACSVGVLAGAGRGGRTPMTRRSADFESAASASSAIPAQLVTG